MTSPMMPNISMIQEGDEWEEEENNDGFDNAMDDQKLGHHRGQHAHSDNDSIPALRERLLAVHRQVRSITLEKTIHSSTVILPKSLEAGNHPLDVHLPLSMSRSFGEENDEPNTSFHLGMTLFGPDVSQTEAIIRDKIRRAELELEQLAHLLNQQEHVPRETTAVVGTTSGSHTTMPPVTSCSHNDDVVGLTYTQTHPLPDNNASVTADPTEHEIELLQLQLRFLRSCSRARELLDESITRSTPALHVSHSSMRQERDNIDSLEDTTNTLSTTSINIQGPPVGSSPEQLLPQSARYLIQAYQAIQDARAMVTNHSHWPSMQAANAKDHASDTHRQSTAREEAFDTVEAIQNACRRQKVILLGQARDMWNSSVQCEEGYLSVRCTSGNTRSSESDSVTNNFHSGEKSPLPTISPLATAYDILTLFAEAADERDTEDGTTVLDLMLRHFVLKLHTNTFQPSLDRLTRHLKKQQQQRTNKQKIQSEFSEADEGIPYVIHETLTRTGTTGTFSALQAHTSSSSTIKSNTPMHVLEWTVNESSCIGDEDDGTCGNGADALANVSDTSNFVFPSAAWKDTFELYQRILSFISQYVLLNRPELCRRVGNRLFAKPQSLSGMDSSSNDESLVFNLDILGLESRRLGDDNGLFMEPLIATLRRTTIPSYLPPIIVAQRMDDTTTSLRSITAPFMKVLRQKGFVYEEQSRLDIFVNSLVKEYVENRRSTILFRARNLLVTNDFHNTVMKGETIPSRDPLGIDDGLSIFKLHQASVSDTASQLMSVCRRAMDESVAAAKAVIGSDNANLMTLPANLYRSARDVLALYRAIIPVRYGQEISTVPRTAAILHNDAVFIAHHCLTLGIEYQAKLPEISEADIKLFDEEDFSRLSNLKNHSIYQLRQTCMFVDMVPLFRDVADRAMGDMLNLQARQIEDIVGPRIILLGKALRSSEILTEWSDAETALSAGLFHLRHLYQTWKKVLAEEILNRSMCYLVDVLCQLYLKQVTQATDISLTASSFISSLFRRASEKIRVLADQDTSSSRNWDQFQAIGRFMDMSMTLSDIEVALTDGVFRSVTGTDLARLIKATYDDSPKRRNLLKLLATHSNQPNL